MIVDLHTHFLNLDRDCDVQVRQDMERCQVDSDRWRFSPQDYLRATEAADHAVVFGLQAECTGWHVPNEVVAAHARSHPDRLIFFASVDPAVRGYMERLEHCHQDLGCRGVKLAPIYQGVHPLDERYCDIYGYCQRHELPIIVHMATTFSSGVPLEYARPAHMDRVAIDFPGLKVVIAHMGHPWEDEAIACIRKQANLFADLSALYQRPWRFYNTMQLLVEYGAYSKVFFGSDYPFATTSDSLAGVRNVNSIIRASGLPRIPEGVIEEILHRDAIKLLGIGLPASKVGERV